MNEGKTAALIKWCVAGIYYCLVLKNKKRNRQHTKTWNTCTIQKAIGLSFIFILNGKPIFWVAKPIKTIKKYKMLIAKIPYANEL